MPGEADVAACPSVAQGLDEEPLFESLAFEQVSVWQTYRIVPEGVPVTVAVTEVVLGVDDESVTVMVQEVGRLGAWKVAVCGAAPDPLPPTHIPPHRFVFQRYGLVPPDTVSCWEPSMATDSDAGETARPPPDPPPLVTVTVADAVAEPPAFVAVSV
jgi:hypothetical protein